MLKELNSWTNNWTKILHHKLTQTDKSPTNSLITLNHLHKLMSNKQPVSHLESLDHQTSLWAEKQQQMWANKGVREEILTWPEFVCFDSLVLFYLHLNFLINVILSTHANQFYLMDNSNLLEEVNSLSIDVPDNLENYLEATSAESHWDSSFNHSMEQYQLFT